MHKRASIFIVLIIIMSKLYTPPPAEAAILWKADHEEGNMADWWYPETPRTEGNNCGGEYNSEGGQTGTTNLLKHSGQYAAFLKTNNIGSSQQGTRLFRWCESQTNSALYYSAWYYIPVNVQVNDWWIIMEWKSVGSNNQKFSIMVENRPDNQMYMVLGRGIDSGGGFWRQTSKNIPVATWFHTEVYYKKAANNSGKITVWQDGQQIIDTNNVKTANSEDLKWAITSYGDKLTPGDLTIYTDDAAISTTRIGNGNPTPTTSTTTSSPPSTNLKLSLGTWYTNFNQTPDAVFNSLDYVTLFTSF